MEWQATQQFLVIDLALYKEPSQVELKGLNHSIIPQQHQIMKIIIQEDQKNIISLDIPIRSQENYWNTLERLERATTKKAKADITRTTGVSRLPLCAASVAFIHPTFFPLDPFHLFYENCMAFIWDVWTVFSETSELVHLSEKKAEDFGRLIPLAMCTLHLHFVVQYVIHI